MAEGKGRDGETSFTWAAEKDRLEQLQELLYAINEELQAIESEIVALPKEERSGGSERHRALKKRQQDALRRFQETDEERIQERKRRGMT